jgi:hypothetical protein
MASPPPAPEAALSFISASAVGRAPGSLQFGLPNSVEVRTMRIVCVGWLAVACFVAIAAPALAQVTPEERRACGPDAMRLCRDLVPDQKKVEACLTEKQAELSEACRAVLAGAQKAAPSAPTEATAKPAATKAAKKVRVAKKRAAQKHATHQRKKVKKKRTVISVKG